MSEPPTVEGTTTAGKSQPLRWPARRFVLLLVTAVGLFLCFRLTVPLLPALTWAFALAVLAWPLHRWIGSRVKQPDLAAALSVIGVTLILVVPATFVGMQLSHEVQGTVEYLRELNGHGGIRAKLKENPRLAPAVDWLEEHVDFPAEARRLADSLTGGVGNFARNSIEAFVQLLVMLFALFYFFRDRDTFLTEVHVLAPLSDLETERLRRRVRDTVEATLYGRLFVAAIQGALGGLMFWWLGMPAPVMWGVVMAILSVVPMLGSFIVWVPVAFFLAIQGEWGKALLLTFWGAVVIGLIDNFLYPMLVGGKMRLHSLVVFVSIIGGLVVFGAAGVILGPVVVSLTDGLLNLWRRPGKEERVGSLVLAN